MGDVRDSRKGLGSRASVRRMEFVTGMHELDASGEAERMNMHESGRFAESAEELSGFAGFARRLISEYQVLK